MIKLSDELYIPPMGDVIAERDRQRAEASKGRKKHKRLYSAANRSRTNSTWTTTPYSANWSLYHDLRRLRARARDGCANSPHFRNFQNLAKSNVIGSRGIVLQCNAVLLNREPNVRVNELVENAWWEWTHRETCSVSGKLNWIAAQRLFVDTLVCDGEVLVQHIAADNAFGYSLKFWNVDYLDETYNDTLPGGNRVIMSVEIDANGKAVAYWMTTPASDINFTRRREMRRERIPADQMTHAFLVTLGEDQVRGVTMYAAVLLEGKNLEGYKEGVIQSARFAANSFGFLETIVDDETELIVDRPVDGNGNEIDVEEDIEINAESLAFNELPPGMKMNQFDPKQPTQHHTEFKGTILLDMAAGLGLNYFSLAGDMSAVNFSSSRIGLAAERDLWKAMQEFTASTLCREVYHHWLRACQLNGRLNLSPREYYELQNPVWQGRGWPYLDPLKDVNASSIAIANGLSTYTKELAVIGDDLEDHLKEKAREQKMMAKYGVQLEIVSVGQPPEPDVPDDTVDETPPKKAQDDGDRGYTNGKYAN